MNALNPDDFLGEIAARLDRFALVPDDMLREIVTGDGSCAWLYRLDLEPEWTGDPPTDRELAARICAGCRAPLACLELELRTAGDQALGVLGALPAEDVRALYPVWLARRRRLAEKRRDQGRAQGHGRDGGQP